MNTQNTIWLVVLVLLLAGCASPAPQPTPVAVQPTGTVTPTATVQPTGTTQPTPRPTRTPRPTATATAPPPTPTIPPFPTTATLTEALEFVRVRATSASSFAARDYTHAVVAFWNTRPADRDQLLGFLDADQRSMRWPPPTQPLTGTLFAEADVTGDQRRDLLTIAPIFPNELVLLTQDSMGTYQPGATYPASLVGATRIWHVGDINADEMPEILLQSAGCDRWMCTLTVDVVQWDGTGFTSLVRDEWPDGTVKPFLSMRYAQASLQDSNGDGVQEIVLTGGDATADEARRRTDPPDIGQNVARGPQRSRTETYTWDGAHYTLAQRTYDPVASQHPWFRLHDGIEAMDTGDLATAIDLYRDALSRPYPQGVPNDTIDPTEQAAIMALLRFRLLLALLLTGETDAAVAHYHAVQAEDELAALWQRVFWHAYQETGNLWSACNVAVAQERLDGGRRFRTFTNQYYDIYAAELLCPERVPQSLLPNLNATAAPTPTVPPAARAAPLPQLVSPQITLPLTDTLHAVTFATAQHGWLSDGTTLLHTTNGDVDWTAVFTAETPITALDFVSSRQGWSLRDGRLWQTDDAGTTWQPLTTPVDGTVEQIDLVDLRHGWISGLDQSLWATDDGGQTWTQRRVPCDLTPDIGAVRLINQATGWVWQPMHLSFPSPTDGIVACGHLPRALLQDKQIYRTSDGGRTWHLQAASGRSDTLPVDVLMDIQAVDRDHVWGVQAAFLYSLHASLAHSDDGGQTWEQLAIPGDVPEWRSVPLHDLRQQMHFLTSEQGYVIIIPPDAPPTLLGTRDGGESWYRAYP